MLSSALLAFLAGLLSLLNPCTLPLIPIVLGTAINRHRYGPVALAAGLTISFVGIGLFVALVGFSVGLDFSLFRMVAGIVMILFGAVLLVPIAQHRMAAATGPVAAWSQAHFGQFDDKGIKGQFLVGLLLGAVWSPCVGPTLGAASLMAARGENLLQVTGTMIAFGVGAALPLLVIGMLSREALARSRHRLLTVGQAGKSLMGGLLVITGALVVSGFDKSIEIWLLDIAPTWMIDLTTRI
ncbi:cytochrome c biogenesis CcdA family protein [Rhizobium sp. 'Codium 1']|uniref:cytochrome c biogenesis CcdA family protein n=1 Tax=Rhizobium sp. 'Codium 1' TaxID=2940484 RepID=UPI001E292BDD|nr:cytochrome c biogenesis CcdA family protein [Rhizobium sp. 'Codium 1']MCC8934378.1 cytochrome c biogenesis CcdA family protein [Rhizobium sp. 'Codium 1']